MSVNVNRSMGVSSKKLGQQNMTYENRHKTKRLCQMRELKVFEKGLDFAPIQNKTTKPKLEKIMKIFCRQMNFFLF